MMTSHPKILSPQNVTLLGNRIVADVKLERSHREPGQPSPCDGIAVGREPWTWVCSGGMLSEGFHRRASLGKWSHKLRSIKTRWQRGRRLRQMVPHHFRRSHLPLDLAPLSQTKCIAAAHTTLTQCLTRWSVSMVVPGRKRDKRGRWTVGF